MSTTKGSLPLKHVREITEKTAVPLSLAIAIALAAMWIAALNERTTTTAAAVAGYVETLNRIDQRLSRIEGKLGVAGK